MGYFTHRKFGSRARTVAELDETVRWGIIGLLRTALMTGRSALSTPNNAPTKGARLGLMKDALRDALAVYRIFNFVVGRDLPSRFETLDVIEFAHEKIVEPRQADFHDFFGHSHLGFVRSEVEMLSAKK